MIEQTKSIMNNLKWLGALQTLDQRLMDATAHGWGHLELLSALITDEKSYRDTNAIKRRIKGASFRVVATLERVDVTAKRTITKTLVRDLMSLSFLKSPRNVIFVGPTGVGKSYLAQAVGEYACRSGYTCLFTGISVLIEKLAMTRADGTFLKLRDRLVRCDLLIIDDMGLTKLPPDVVIDLHDILEERQNRSTMFTTQLPLKNWKEIIDDPLAFDTIYDKLKNGTMSMEIEGESYRKTKDKIAAIDNHCVPVEIAEL